ncbi:unnamed protein product [Prorocentrum cordatum]|uniref:Protein kinase domain-containing protein n=1 Tax=Prorocentrum cordatum TaxID=2364126 RepID=A0ABN9XU45_9DINO|nr:unnamed protein product [Polarella glacialis]
MATWTASRACLQRSAQVFWALALARGPIAICADCWQVVNGLSHLDQESIQQSGQSCETSLRNELAGAVAQRGAELTMADMRDEAEQFMEIETLFRSAWRRAAAIARDACKGAGPAMHERPRQAPSKVSLEQHGYVAERRLGGSSTADVLVVSRLGQPGELSVVKSMALRGLDPEGDVRISLPQEIKILKRLRHPSIIRYVESWWNGVGPESGRLTVVMEFAEDRDLREPVNPPCASARPSTTRWCCCGCARCWRACRTFTGRTSSTGT